VIHRDVFEEVVLFDESLPACEDYYLWLRIGCRLPIGLLDVPLIVKRGGRPDQLSAAIPALDRFRIRALVKLLENEPLSEIQRAQVIDVLRRIVPDLREGCMRQADR
jgi:hypothetical protein